MSVGITSPNLQGPKRVKDLIQRSYRIAHVLGKGEGMSLVIAADGLESLNDLIEQAMIEKTFATYQTEIPIPLQAQKILYTVGPSTASPPADVIATRPTEVLSAYSRRSGRDLPLLVTHAKQDYDGVPNKNLASTGWSGLIYYQVAYPSGNVFVYPSPADDLTTVYLTVLSVIEPYLSLDEEVSLPPGTYQYLKYALAKRVAADHAMPFGPENQEILDRCEAAFERNNIKALPVVSTGLNALSSGFSGYDIRSDTTRGY